MGNRDVADWTKLIRFGQNQNLASVKTFSFLRL